MDWRAARLASVRYWTSRRKDRSDQSDMPEVPQPEDPPATSYDQSSLLTPTGGGAWPPARSAAERCPCPNAGEFSHPWNAASSRHLVTTSQVARPSVGLSSSKPSKPSWLSTAPARAANLRASSSPLSAGTVIALILTTVMPTIMPAPAPLSSAATPCVTPWPPALHDGKFRCAVPYSPARLWPMLDPDFVLDAAARERLLDRFGPDAEPWCDGLAGLVAGYCQRWGLELDEALSGGTSRVFLGRQDGARPVVLKLTPDRSIAESEAIALRAWARTPHAVDLLESEPEAGALLLDRVTPGTKVASWPGLPPFEDFANCSPDSGMFPGRTSRRCLQARKAWSSSTASSPGARATLM